MVPLYYAKFSFSLGRFRSRAKAYSNNSNEAQSSFFGGKYSKRAGLS
jgi:hypothetical protein